MSRKEGTAEDRKTWIQHAFMFAGATAAFHFLQLLAGLTLWLRLKSPALMAYGLDAGVSSLAALVLAVRIQRSFDTLGDNWRSRTAAYGYIGAAFVVLCVAVIQLWRGERAEQSILGIVLASVSMLVIPIVGSYLKTLAVELRSQPLKSAAIFTFGNSYLSMVLLIALLMSTGMNFRWGDPLGALVMFPFIAQKGIQFLVEEGKQEYVED